MTDEGTRQHLDRIITDVLRTCIPSLPTDVYEHTTQQLRERLDISPETYPPDDAVYRWVSGWNRKPPP